MADYWTPYVSCARNAPPRVRPGAGMGMIPWLIEERHDQALRRGFGHKIVGIDVDRLLALILIAEAAEGLWKNDSSREEEAYWCGAERVVEAVDAAKATP